LAAEVRRYIDEDRSALLAKRALSDEKSNALFLSERTGKPLTNRHIIKLFSSAFRGIGAPKGAGLHPFRRKRAVDVSSDEIAYRQSQGIVVVPEDVAAVVQTELGHSTRAAQVAYLRASGKHRKNSPQVLLRHHLLQAQLRGDRLKARVEELERQLAKHA